MIQYKVFILDSDLDLIEKIKYRIHNSSQFKFVSSATTIEEGLRKLKVLGDIDILITNIFLEEDDKLSFINKIRNNSSYKIKRIICISDIYQNEIFRSLNSFLNHLN